MYLFLTFQVNVQYIHWHSTYRVCGFGHKAPQDHLLFILPLIFFAWILRSSYHSTCLTCLLQLYRETII